MLCFYLGIYSRLLCEFPGLTAFTTYQWIEYGTAHILALKVIKPAFICFCSKWGKQHVNTTLISAKSFEADCKHKATTSQLWVTSGQCKSIIPPPLTPFSSSNFPTEVLLSLYHYYTSDSWTCVIDVRMVAHGENILFINVNCFVLHPESKLVRAA